MQVHADHFDAVGGTIDGDENELREALGDAADMLLVFIVEDFFTARFGERGELNVIDDYLEQRGWCESVQGGSYLEGLRDATPSLYEVIDSDPGRSLTVRDLIVDGEAVTVQALLSSRLRDLVGPALISSQDPNRALENHSSVPAGDDVGPPPEEAVQAIHSYLDEHYRRTLDEPLPALGGRTLRQAAKTKKGRREAIDWLKQLENVEYLRAAEQGQRAYDTRWTWQELGIERTG